MLIRARTAAISLTWMSAHRRSLVALALLGLLLSGCAGLPRNFEELKAPEVFLTGLALKEANLFKPSFLVRLRVANPNDLEVNLEGAEVALALNGQPVAAGASRNPLSLARLGSSDMEVEVSADTLGVVQQFLALSNKPALDYGISGHLTVLNWLGPLGRIPFNFTGTVDRETLWRGAESLGKAAVAPANTTH